MQPYLNHLLDDLEKAAQNIPPIPEYKSDKPYWEPEYMAAWEQAPEEPLHQILGIDPESFPPVERLEEAQVNQMIEAIQKLWKAFNFFPDFPEGLPPAKHYELLVKTMKEGMVQYLDGRCDMDICDYDVPNCVYGSEFCRCKDIEVEDMESYNKGETGDLPF